MKLGLPFKSQILFILIIVFIIINVIDFNAVNASAT